MLEEALEHLVKGIVENPDDVRVDSHGLRRGRVLEVRVHPEDLGKVIGRGGRTAKALRTVIGSLAGGKYVRVDLLDVDEVSLATSCNWWSAGSRRPHGVRGEVSVEVAHRRPQTVRGSPWAACWPPIRPRPGPSHRGTRCAGIPAGS